MKKPANDTYVLLIEDDPISAQAIKSILEARGCQVDLVSTGQEALNCLSHKYQLIILDLELPDIHGLEVAINIRQQSAEIAAIPIVILTSHDQQHELSLARKIGINGFLTKPLTPNKCNILLETTTA